MQKKYKVEATIWTHLLVLAFCISVLIALIKCDGPNWLIGSWLLFYFLLDFGIAPLVITFVLEKIEEGRGRSRKNIFWKVIEMSEEEQKRRLL